MLRYDYRGVGESAGVFEETTFEQWSEDVEILASWLRSQTPDVPLLLHGLEIGALLAGTLAKHIGAPLTVCLGGIGAILGAIWFARSLPSFRIEGRELLIASGMAPGPPPESISTRPSA